MRRQEPISTGIFPMHLKLNTHFDYSNEYTLIENYNTQDIEDHST